LMTSTNSPVEIEKCRELGVSSFVNKPVTFATFAKAVADNFHSPSAVFGKVHDSLATVD
jgi:hypothetical protein